MAERVPACLLWQLIPKNEQRGFRLLDNLVLADTFRFPDRWFLSIHRQIFCFRAYLRPHIILTSWFFPLTLVYVTSVKLNSPPLAMLIALATSGKKDNNSTDISLQLDKLQIENENCRHSSRPKSLNFYPTALFAKGVLAIPHCSTFASPHKPPLKPKACKRAAIFHRSIPLDLNTSYYQ